MIWGEAILCAEFKSEVPWFDRKTKNKSKLKMDFTGNTEDLRTVYELCEPNHEGLISLRKLQELFQSHSSSVS